MKAAIILAAGESSRMGFPKQLAEYKGKTILETVVETVSNSIENSIVVLGHENETLTEKIDFKNSTILINESWEEGIISSIRTGLFYLSSDKNIDFKSGKISLKIFLVFKKNFVNFKHEFN